jgi:peptidoglycan hydrolase-like protein with peptidoglycan-binding domain
MNSRSCSLCIASFGFVALFLLAPHSTRAAGTVFPADLHYGMRSDSVGQLQDFLRAGGYFHDETSGGFFAETRAAVQAWQAAQCVPSTGYFGALSRYAAATGSRCPSAAIGTSSTSAPLTSVTAATTSPAGDSGIFVVIDGKYYVRTTNGLMPIHGGMPHGSNGTASAPAPTPTYLLTVSKAGSSGTGTVTSSPAGIACGATCSASYAQGATVTLTAVADSGSSFFGWSGGGCSGTGACTVTMSAATAVTAIFPINLSVNPPPDLTPS